MIRVERLQLVFETREDAGIQQLSQLGVAQQLAELRVIDRERLGAAFRERRIAVVQERRDVVEEQRRGKRRRAAACRR